MGDALTKSGQYEFYVDTKSVRFNVFNFRLHQNYIDMDGVV